MRVARFQPTSFNPFGPGLKLRLGMSVLLVMSSLLVALYAARIAAGDEHAFWDRIMSDTSNIAGSDPSRPSIRTFIVIGMLLDELYARTPTAYVLAADIRGDKDSVRHMLASTGHESVAREVYWAIQGAHAFRVAPADASNDFQRNIQAFYLDALSQTALEYKHLSPSLDVEAVRVAIARLSEPQSEVVPAAAETK